jgi:hypothetical protein
LVVATVIHVFSAEVNQAAAIRRQIENIRWANREFVVLFVRHNTSLMLLRRTMMEQ